MPDYIGNPTHKHVTRHDYPQYSERSRPVQSEKRMSLFDKVVVLMMLRKLLK